MKTYKDLKALEKRCIKNNGKKVNIWSDEGIKVGGKIFRQMEYGNISNHCYITFRNVFKRGYHPSYAYRDNFDWENDRFITIEYHLNSDEDNKNMGYLFEYIKIRETW